MTIKDLSRWESLEMLQRYMRSVSFHDSLKFYKAPLSSYTTNQELEKAAHTKALGLVDIPDI